MEIAHLNYFPYGIDIGIYNKLKVKSELAIKNKIKIKFYVISNFEEEINQNLKIIKCDTKNILELKLFKYNVIKRNFDFNKYQRIILRYPKCIDFSSRSFITEYGNKIFTEHHALEVEEIKVLEGNSFMTKFKVFIEKINRVYFLNKTRGIIGVTNHILDSKNELLHSPKPTFLFSNGNLFQEQLLNHGEPNVYKLLFISGTFSQPWAGLERLISSLDEYTGKNKVVLTLIGQLTNTQLSLIKQLNIKPNISVIVKGQIFKSNLRKYYVETDACFGSLSPHKSDSQEACALKIREALSFSKPIIYAGIDTDIKSKVKWALNIEANDDLIDFDAIINFLDLIKTNPDFGSEIEEYFNANISWLPKLKRLVNFCLNT